MKIQPTRLFRYRRCLIMQVFMLIGFIVLLGRFWHPYFGFTSFLQFDQTAAAVMLPALRHAPIFIHDGEGSYDGLQYAQIATDPTLGDPHLAEATDDLGYRARRMLLGIIAWAAGRGDPVEVVRAFAWLNPLIWCALGILSMRLFSSGNCRDVIGWAGVMFATGAVLSVRLALTDLAALFLLGLALWSWERNRRWTAVACLALASLARETAILGCIILLKPAAGAPMPWRRMILLTIASVLPLLAWLAYIHWQIGPSGLGQGNFAYPGIAWWHKVRNVIPSLHSGENRILAAFSLLALGALVIQAFYVVSRLDWANPWWWAGVSYAGLMACLGPAVLGDDLPGASVRLLLPLTLVFNVLAVRNRASYWWLIPGNLSVLGGILAMWTAPSPLHEVSAGNSGGIAYSVNIDSQWFGVEKTGARKWAWCGQQGNLLVKQWPVATQPRKGIILIKGFTRRTIEIRADQKLLWRGDIGERPTPVEFDLPAAENGIAKVTLSSPTPPIPENSTQGARALGFAVYGFEIR